MTAINGKSRHTTKGDLSLIAAVRAGDAAAFGELYERHAAACLRVARIYVSEASDAQDAVAEAFTRIYATLLKGGGPRLSFRAYAYTVVRRVCISFVTERANFSFLSDPETSDVDTVVPGVQDLALARFENVLISRSFQLLSKRHQEVLWYTEVENLSAKETGHLLGLTANAVAVLGFRAREELRKAYLTVHMSVVEEQCRPYAAKFGAYVRGAVSRRDSTRIQCHLSDCPGCLRIIAELAEVERGLKTQAAPGVLRGAVSAQAARPTLASGRQLQVVDLGDCEDTVGSGEQVATQTKADAAPRINWPVTAIVGVAMVSGSCLAAAAAILTPEGSQSGLASPAASVEIREASAVASANVAPPASSPTLDDLDGGKQKTNLPQEVVPESYPGVSQSEETLQGEEEAKAVSPVVPAPPVVLRTPVVPELELPELGTTALAPPGYEVPLVCTPTLTPSVPSELAPPQQEASEPKAVFDLELGTTQQLKPVWRH